jgi:uncharacterized membrane protein YcaP (DUF421 family)
MIAQDLFSIFLRTVGMYVVLVLAFRFFGKKEMAKLSSFDLVFLLLVSESAQNSMTDLESNWLSGIASIFGLFLINFLFKIITYYSAKANKIIEGEPVLLIYKGKVLQKNLHKYKITHDELYSSMREKGIIRTDEIEFAMLETEGYISMIKKKKDNPEEVQYDDNFKGDVV